MFLIIGVSRQALDSTLYLVYIQFTSFRHGGESPMSEPEAPQGKLFTLSEISQKTGISMPTLQRYKKMYQDRIPAEGKGRKQRYPESALPVFDELRNENPRRPGRPAPGPGRRRPR